MNKSAHDFDVKYDSIKNEFVGKASSVKAFAAYRRPFNERQVAPFKMSIEDIAVMK